MVSNIRISNYRIGEQINKVKMLPAVKPLFLNSSTFSGKLIRSLTTWSRLASSFNNIGQKKSNFQLGFGEKTGLFGHSVLREPTGFYLLKEHAIQDAESYVDEALSAKRSRKMVQVFDDLSDALCRVADMVFQFNVSSSMPVPVTPCSPSHTHCHSHRVLHGL